MSDFSARHVVITGGDGALGKAVVAAFAAAGAECHLPQYPQVDLTNEAHVVQYYAALPQLFASVHLAGGYTAKPFVDTSQDDMERMLLLNLATAFFCSREAVKLMKKTGGGRIVNVAARVVEVPIGGAVAYSVSKAGVAALTQALAVECKPDGILVNAVLPSIIDTAANRASMPKADYSKWPKPEEIARAILWLASPENTLTSGTLLPVYGRA